MGHPSNLIQGIVADDPSVMPHKHFRRMTTAKFSSDGLFICTGGDDNTVRLWDLRLQKNVKILPAHLNPLLEVDYLTEKIEDLRTKLSRVIQSDENPVLSKVSGGSIFEGSSADDLIISHPNNYIMTGDNTGQVKVWDWQNSEIVFQEKLCKEQEKVAGLSFSRDFQQVLVGCLEKKIMYVGREAVSQE